MNRSFNRYRHWLGISDSAPDHFQLLGIGPAETDPARIEQAAKAALQKLGKQPTDDLEADWQKLKREIRAAYKCLTDEKQRAAYLADIASRNTDISSINEDEDITTNIESDETPESEIVGAASDPAVPMAKVVDAPPVVDGAGSQESAQSFAGPKISTKKKLRRKSGLAGLIVAILLMLILVGAIGGGIWFLLQQKQNSVEDRLAEKQPNNESKNNDDSENQQENNGDQSNSNNDNNTTDANQQNNENNGSINDVDGNSSAQDQNNGNTEEQSALDASTQTLEQTEDFTEVETSANDLVLLNNALEQAWFGLQTRDFDWSADSIAFAKTLTLSQEHRDLLARLETVNDAYKKFWVRVDKKARELPALTELEVNETLISVTEAKPDQVVFRARGTRLTYPYNQIPNGIAVAIAQREADMTDPDMLQELCSVYAVATRTHPTLLPETRKIFRRAEKASLRVTAFRDFIKDDYDSDPESLINVPKPPRVAVDEARNQMADQLQALRDDARTQALFEVDAAAVDEADDANKWLLGQTAIDAAIERKNAFSLIRFLSLTGSLEPANRQVIGKFNALARENLSEEQAIRLIQACLYLQEKWQVADPETTEKLIKIARDAATDQKLASWIEYLDRRFSGEEPETGRLTL